MKVKTKLIMSIMSICLVCAVFAIGVFALKTANLKIGGDVSFSATGVEAKIKNATLKLDADSQAQVLATGEINTSMTQGDIDNTFENWQTLELDFNEDAENIVFKFDIVNTSANLDHYIEMDYTYSFNNENPNVDVFPGYFDNGEYVNNEYILAPKGQTPADGDYQTFILNFIVLDKEINVPDNTKVNLTIKLKHHKVTAATDLGGAYAFDGLVYGYAGSKLQLWGPENGMPEVVNISPVIKIGENYCYVEDVSCTEALYSNIKVLNMPNSMTKMSGCARFGSLTNLENITFSKSLIDYGDFSIDFCKSSPWYANLSDGEVYINNRLFGYKGTMPENTKIKVKEGTISIGNEAFKNYTNLTGIMLPDTLKSIGVNVFSGCTGLTSIVIPKNLTEIYSLPENLASIAVAQDNPKYDSRNNCNAIIEKQTNTLIFGCKNTVIPNDVTSIGDSAFSGCEITEITLPNGLVNIGYMAFAYSSLTSITIPSSVTTIGISAFAGSDLTTAKFDNPSNWIRANSATATTGTAVTVTSDFTEANATELKKDDGTYLLRKTA